MARTGFASRFLMGGRASGRLGQVMITAFALVAGLCFCVGGAVTAAKGAREALDPGSTLYRLRRLSPAGRTAGALRLSAPLRGDSADHPPICDVIHEHYVSGKNGGWRRDSSWLRSAGARLEGAGLHVLRREPVVFDPLDRLVVGPAREAWFRTVLADVPAGGRLRAHCVAHGEVVFLEGCVDRGAALTGCGARPLTLTTGDGTAQPRIDAHASDAAAKLAFGAAALVLALSYVWFVVRARPLAGALLRRAGRAPAFDAWPQAFAIVAAALLGMLAQGLMVWPAEAGSAASRGRPGYLLGLLVCAVAGVLALVVRHRRRTLERAMAPVREAETVPLRDARGGVVELAVKVRDDGALVTGVFDASPHAWVEVHVEEAYAQGKQQLTRTVTRRHWPDVIPVRDASGDGLIDPRKAELDLRSRVTTFKQGSTGAVAQAVARSPVGPLRPSATHSHFIVEESVLDPGEALYVLGDCHRIEDPKAAGSYRADSTLPVVGGVAERIILHAGDERSLLRSIGVEVTWLDLLAAALGATAASLAGVMAALWSL